MSSPIPKYKVTKKYFDFELQMQSSPERHGLLLRL